MIRWASPTWHSFNGQLRAIEDIAPEIPSDRDTVARSIERVANPYGDEGRRLIREAFERGRKNASEPVKRRNA